MAEAKISKFSECTGSAPHPACHAAGSTLTISPGLLLLPKSSLVNSPTLRVWHRGLSRAWWMVAVVEFGYFLDVAPAPI